MNPFTLPPSTHIANIHLQVSNLDRSLSFYSGLMGFKETHRGKASADLSASGTGPLLIRLSEYPDARPKPSRTTGLYHVAIRLPDRSSLAHLFQHLINNQVPFQGFSDHKVSEALYLADPDSIGLELYVDRPRDQWPRMDDMVAMTTEPLDIEDLLRQRGNNSSQWDGIPPETDIGHIHLQVSDLAETEDFYHTLLGFDVTQRSYPGALFLSAGGYHHHIGTNTWSSRAAPPPPVDAVGLLSYSIKIPDWDAWETLYVRLQESGIPIEYLEADQTISLLLHDPSQNHVELIVDRSTRAPLS